MPPSSHKTWSQDKSSNLIQETLFHVKMDKCFLFLHASEMELEQNIHTSLFLATKLLPIKQENGNKRKFGTKQRKSDSMALT